MEHADQVLEEILQANGERLMYSPQKDYPDYANDREESPLSDTKESQLEASFFSSTTSSIYKLSEQLSKQSSDITPLSSDEDGIAHLNCLPICCFSLCLFRIALIVDRYPKSKIMLLVRKF